VNPSLAFIEEKRIGLLYHSFGKWMKQEKQTELAREEALERWKKRVKQDTEKKE